MSFHCWSPSSISFLAPPGVPTGKPTGREKAVGAKNLPGQISELLNLSLCVTYFRLGVLFLDMGPFSLGVDWGGEFKEQIRYRL